MKKQEKAERNVYENRVNSAIWVLNIIVVQQTIRHLVFHPILFLLREMGLGEYGNSVKTRESRSTPRSNLPE